MTRLRLTCKAPPTPKGSPGLTMLPSMHDTHVFLVEDDGTETEISTHFCEVSWSVKPNHEAIAVATIIVDEVDVEGLGDIVSRPRAWGGFDWRDYTSDVEQRALARTADGAVEYAGRVYRHDHGWEAMVTRNGTLRWLQLFDTAGLAREAATRMARQAADDQGDHLV